MTQFIPGKLYKTAQQCRFFDTPHSDVLVGENVILMFVKEETCGHEGYRDYIFLLEDMLMTLCYSATSHGTSLNFLFWGPL